MREGGGGSTSGNNSQVFVTYDRMLLPPQKFNNMHVRVAHKQLSGLPWLVVSVSTLRVLSVQQSLLLPTSWQDLELCFGKHCASSID